MSSSEDTYFKPSLTVSIPKQDILSWIFDQPGYPEDEPIYIDAENPGNSLSRKQTLGLVRKLIAGFGSTSLQKGDCVCVHSFNNLYYSCLLLAVVGAGFIWTGTNPGYTSYELEHQLKTSKAKFVISEAEIYDDISPVAEACGIPKANILIFDGLEPGEPHSMARGTSWRSLLQFGEQDWIRFNEESLAQSTIACLLFSSGTTGLPKAASLSHYNLIAQHTLVHEQLVKPYKVKRILCLPFFHAGMVPLGHVTPLKAGQVSYVMRRFQLEEFLKYTEKYEVTEIFVVPPIITAVVQSPLIKKYSLKSLRCGMTGGAKVDLKSQKAFTALMHPEACLNPCYGMTELSCLGACYPWPEQDTDGSIGYFLNNIEVKLVDHENNEIRAHDISGELLIRGPTVIKGYFDNPEANASSFTDGWFHTGDIGYCNSKTNKWYIVDRKKELIKVRGFQVAPTELEAVLMSHPLVADAAVIGVPALSAIDGEVPRAYIVRNLSSEGHKLGESDIKQYVSERLAKYKQLNGGVVFVNALPKTASGKYLKRQLRDQWRQKTEFSSKL